METALAKVTMSKAHSARAANIFAALCGSLGTFRYSKSIAGTFGEDEHAAGVCLYKLDNQKDSRMLDTIDTRHTRTQYSNLQQTPSMHRRHNACSEWSYSIRQIITPYVLRRVKDRSRAIEKLNGQRIRRNR